VAGNVYDGKHLWECQDTGGESALTVLNSYTLAGDVICMAFSPTTRRLYASIGVGIYCYDVDTMSLVTSWATNGFLSTTYTIYNIAIDSSDYLAISQHDGTWNSSDLGFISLVDNTGSIVWSTPAQGYVYTNSASFDINGNVHAGKINSGVAGQLLARSNGAVLVTYPGGSTFTAIKRFVADKQVSGRVYFDNGGTLYCYEGTTLKWSRSISDGARDRFHSSDLDFLVCTANTHLNVYPDLDGLNDSRMDYSPQSVILQLGNSIYALDYNLNTHEVYSSYTARLVVGNMEGSSRVATEIIPVGNLKCLAWIGTSYTAPTITDQPESMAAKVGGSATFTVVAEGYPSPTYQWKKDGNVLSGETSSTLSFTVTASSGGSYTCEVTNLVGSTTSNSATLSIISSVVSQSSDTISLLGQLVTLGVTAAGAAPITYQWYKNGSPLSGETSDVLTFNSTTSTPGTYTCVVSNAYGSDTSNPIIVSNITNPYIWNLFNLTLDAGRAD
jgi:hypothetical protein